MMPRHQQEIDYYWFTDHALPPDFQPKAGGIHVIAQALYDGVHYCSTIYARPAGA